MRPASHSERSWCGSATNAAVLVDAGGPPGVMEEHEREQAARLGLVGHQANDQAAEPDRLGTELAAHEPVAARGVVALVEDQVDDGEDHAQAVGEHVVRRDAIGDAGAAILRLARTIRCAIVASLTRNARATSAVLRPPSRRSVSADLRVARQRRVAAGEHQPQAVVGDRRGFLLVRRRRCVALGEERQPLDAIGDGTRAAQAIDRLAPRGGGDPGARVRRDAVAGPRRHRGGERVLQGVLGQADVADVADQRGEDRRALVAEGPLDGVHAVAAAGISMIGRTSTVPYCALGTFAAQASAASRSGASIT